MIDFNNASFFKLTMVGNDTFRSQVTPILTEDESILSTYKGIRDGVVFTTKRIIAINVQGITGKKKDFTSMPYSKIQVYSVESLFSKVWQSMVGMQILPRDQARRGILFTG